MILGDDVFAQMVAEEVKNKLSGSQRETLLKEENWDRWLRALVALSENLAAQIDNISTDSESDANRYRALGKEGQKLVAEAAAAYAFRKNKIERFKFHVDKRLDQVTKMTASGEPIDLNPYEAAAFYRKAIARHQELFANFDLESTILDVALWAALKQQWKFDEITYDDFE
jgi:hypothetical protein